MTIGLTPPPSPEPAPQPCPHCGAGEAITVYATSRVQYLRCVSCRQVRTVEVAPHTSAAA